MKKHIYLHTSNLDVRRNLDDTDEFEKVFEYPKSEFDKIHRNEWGRFDISGNYYHILLGNIAQDGCPWCGSEYKVKKLESHIDIDPLLLFNRSGYCLQCIGCGSQGPILNISPEIEYDSRGMSKMLQLLESRYKTRRMWDDELKNEQTP